MPGTIPYAADPIPWLTESFVANGCFDMSPVPYSWPAKMTAAPSAKAATLDTLTAIVSALNDDQRTYSVRWTSEPTASTSFHGKVVNIGGAALVDEALTDGQKAAILTGLAYHEVAHVRYTRKLMPAIEKAYGKDPAAMRMSNVAEDIRIERLITRDFPGYRDTLPITLRWVTGSDAISVADLSTYGGRWNAFVGAARYPFAWTFRDADKAWRDQVRAWCDLAGNAHTTAKNLAAIEAGLLLIGKPEPPKGPKPDDIIEKPPIDIDPDDDEPPIDIDLPDDDEPEDEDGDGDEQPEGEDTDEPQSEGPAPEDDQPQPDGPVGPVNPGGDDDEDEDDGDDEPGEDNPDEQSEPSDKPGNDTGRGNTAVEGNSDDETPLPPLDHDFCPSHDKSTSTGREKGWMSDVEAWKKSEKASEGRRIFRDGGTAKVVRRIKIMKGDD